MELKYKLTGSDRKRLVTAISEILQSPAVYKGAPTFAYEAGGYTIDKDGTVTYSDALDSSKLIDGLAEKGFEPDLSDTPDSLVISYPRKDISDEALEKLRRLVASKETLIKKALGTAALPIEVTDETVSFPWFKGFPKPEEISAYAHFTGKLIGMAKTQKRVTAKEKEIANEKYTFRCFLIRLGFIGAEYKDARKILLRNLSGSGAFRNGNPKTREYIEKIEDDAELYDEVMSLQDKEAADDEISE